MHFQEPSALKSPIFSSQMVLGDSRALMASFKFFQQTLMKFDNLIAFRHLEQFSLQSELFSVCLVKHFANAFDVRVTRILPAGQTLPFRF